MDRYVFGHDGQRRGSSQSPDPEKLDVRFLARVWEQPLKRAERPHEYDQRAALRRLQESVERASLSDSSAMKEAHDGYPPYPYECDTVVAAQPLLANRLEAMRRTEHLYRTACADYEVPDVALTPDGRRRSSRDAFHGRRRSSCAAAVRPVFDSVSWPSPSRPGSPNEIPYESPQRSSSHGKVHLLLGDGGMGKTMTLVRLWVDAFDGFGVHGHTPVFVPLPQVLPGTLSQYLMRHLVLPSECEADLKKEPLIVFFDALDEVAIDMRALLKERRTLYDTLELGDWPNATFFVTCRPEYLMLHGLEHSDIHRGGRLTAWYLQPPSEGMIAAIVCTTAAKEGITDDRAVAELQALLRKSGVCTTPFLAMLSTTALLGGVAPESIDLWSVYVGAVHHHYWTRGLPKVRSESLEMAIKGVIGTQTDVWAFLVQQAYEFGAALAMKTFRDGTWVSGMDEGTIPTDDPVLRRCMAVEVIRRSLLTMQPLRAHKTVHEHFVATSLGRMSIEARNEELKDTSGLMSGVCHQLATLVLVANTDDEDSLWTEAYRLQLHHYHPKIAILLYERLLDSEVIHFGSNHPNVANTLTTLGNVYGDLGDVIMKRELLKRSLGIQEAHFGPNHLEVSKTLGDLASAYGALGDAAKQRELLERSLAIQEIHFGHDHPDVAITLEGLGSAYSALGDVAKEREFLERLLAIQETHFGPNHQEVARTLMKLGNAYGDLGDAAKKRELLLKSLAIQEAHFGPNHPTVAMTLADLGNSLGDATKKRELLERSLAIQEDHFGPNHPNLGSPLTNLGNVYGELGQAIRKRELLERSLVIKEANFGPTHPSVAITLTNLGNVYGALGDATKKRELLERSLAILEAHFGPTHPDVANTLTNLGNVYGDLGDAAKKRELLERSLGILETRLGPSHPDVAITLLNLGISYGELGDAAKMRELLERSLAIQVPHVGPNHPNVAKTMTNLGNAYGALGDTIKKRELLEKSLAIQEAHFGPNHQEVARTLTNLGNAYGALGDLVKQRDMLERAHEIFHQTGHSFAPRVQKMLQECKRLLRIKEAPSVETYRWWVRVALFFAIIGGICLFHVYISVFVISIGFAYYRWKMEAHVEAKIRSKKNN